MAFIRVFSKLPTVYIMSNRWRTVFYIGVTGYPSFRIRLHRLGIGSIFTARYRCTELMYYEHHETMMEAIVREKRLKNWRREWKLHLIRKMNPHMKDLRDVFKP